MDFFETREKYRRREVHIYMRWLSRIFFLGLALWLGWQWGSLEQRSCRRMLIWRLYEREQQIKELSGRVEGLEHDLLQLRATSEANALTDEAADSKLTRLIRGQIAQRHTYRTDLPDAAGAGKPVNCRSLSSHSVAVATELYSGVESNITLFDGGLGLHIEGQPQAQGSKNEPWFDPKREISARYIYLGSQKVEKGILPLRTVLPAEDWVLVVDIRPSELRGYVVVDVQNCAIRIRRQRYGVISNKSRTAV